MHKAIFAYQSDKLKQSGVSVALFQADLSEQDDDNAHDECKRDVEKLLHSQFLQMSGK
jgi:hypothetical protein